MNDKSTGFRIDLHVHTMRYSGCAEFMDPFEIDPRCRAAAIQAVVLTDHDMLWPNAALEEIRSKSLGTRFFKGIECSAAECHIVLVGLEDATDLHRGLPAQGIIDIAHAQDAVAILAHPFRDTNLLDLPLQDFDAIEIDSTSFLGAERRLAIELAQKLGKTQVASSDAHALSLLGWAWTEFDREPSDEKELASMIRLGQCRPIAHSRGQEFHLPKASEYGVTGS